jgi:hypothetical protein
MIKAGKAKVGDGLDVGHVKGIAKGGTNSLTNLAMESPASNRSFKRKSSGAMASERSKKEAAKGIPGQVIARRKRSK